MTHSCSATSQPNRSVQHAYCARCRRSPGLGFDQNLEPAVDHALDLEGHRLGIADPRVRWSFITLALPRSRWARDLNMIQENTTVSPGFALAKRGNGTLNLTLRSSPAHSRYLSAPCSPQILPAFSAMRRKPANSSWGPAEHIHRRTAREPSFEVASSIIVGDCTTHTRAAGVDEAIRKVKCHHFIRRCNYFFLSICARRRSSCSLSSGLNSAPKSSASNSWRISISDSVPGKGFGQRLTHSTASSFDLTCHSQ
jgi:hypothetical protein